MRTGRPAFHVKAHWISIDIDGKSTFYELDNKGQLIKKNGMIQPHHEQIHEVAPPIEAATVAPSPPPSRIDEYTQEEKNNVVTVLAPDPPLDFTMDQVSTDICDIEMDWLMGEFF